MAHSAETAIFLDEDEVAQAADGFDDERSLNGLEYSFQQLMDQSLQTSGTKNENFVFQSLDEVVGSLSIDQTKWQKASTVSGGDVLKKDSGDGKREWVYKSTGEKEVSITAAVAGTEIETRHSEILEGLYSKGFAISEFQKDETTIAKEIYFADAKGNISFEIYYAQKEILFSEDLDSITEIDYDDGDDDYGILNPVGQTSTSSSGFFSFAKATLGSRASSEASQNGSKSNENIFDIFSSKLTKEAAPQPNLFDRLAGTKPAIELSPAQDVGIKLEAGQDDYDDGDIQSPQVGVKNAGSRSLSFARERKDIKLVEKDAADEDFVPVFQSKPRAAKPNPEQPTVELTGIHLEPAGDEIFSDSSSGPESQSLVDTNNVLGISIQEPIIPVLPAQKTQQETISGALKENDDPNSFFAPEFLSPLPPKPETGQASLQADGQHIGKVDLDSALRGKNSPLGIELVLRLDPAEDLNTKFNAEQDTSAAIDEDVTPLQEMVIDRVEKASANGKIESTAPLRTAANIANWTIREHFVLPSFAKERDTALIPETVDALKAEEEYREPAKASGEAEPSAQTEKAGGISLIHIFKEAITGTAPEGTDINEGRSELEKPAAPIAQFKQIKNQREQNAAHQKQTEYRMARAVTVKNQEKNIPAAKETVVRPAIKPIEQKSQGKTQIKNNLKIEQSAKPAIELQKNFGVKNETVIRPPVLRQKERAIPAKIISINRPAPRIEQRPQPYFADQQKLAGPISIENYSSRKTENYAPRVKTSSYSRPAAAKQNALRKIYSEHRNEKLANRQGARGSNLTGISLAEEQDLFDNNKAEVSLAA